MRVGSEVAVPGRGKLRILRELGSGTQGTVFAVSLRGEDVALKRFHPPSGDEATRRLEQARQRLKALVARSAPDPRLAWPQAVVELGDTFGYLMPLLPSRLKSFNAIIFDRVRPQPGDRALVTAGLNLALSLHRLHLEGLVYQDLNLGGPRIEPRSGELGLCDMDNVTTSGSPGGVLTTATAAPEVLRGEAPLSNRTDDHSLAVLLFLLLVRNHPLDGAREARCNSLNEPTLRRLYGKEPLFIFDPGDHSNAPVRGVHDPALSLWPRLPTFVQEAFRQSFTDGLHHPEARPTDGQWLRVLSRYRDALFTCQRCGQQAAYERQLRDQDQMPCSWCGQRSGLPPRMRIEKDILLLEPGKQVHAHHLGRTGDFSVVAEVVSGSGLLGLRNLGEDAWRYENDGCKRQLAPGKALTLKDRREIDFGTKRGMVRW